MEDSTEGIVQFEVLSLRSFRRRCRACGTRPLDARRGHFDGDARRRVGADGRMSKRRGGKKEDRCYGDGPRDVLSSPIAAWAVATPSKTFPFSIKSALPGGPTHTNHQPCPACEEAAADYHFRRREELKTTLHLLLQLSKKESKSPHRLRVLSLLVALQTVSWLSFPLPRAVAVSVASKKNLKEEAGSCRPSPAAEQSLPEDKPGQVVQQGFAQFTKKEGKVAGKEEQIAELKPGSGNRVFWTCCEGAAPTVHAALREDNRVVKQLVTAVAEALADYLVDEEDPPPAMLNRHTLHGFFFGTWKEVWNSASGLEQERTQHIVAAWLGRCFLSIQFHSPCTSQVMAEAFLSRLLTCSQASFLQSRCRGPLVSTACVLALPALSLLPLSSLSRLLSPFFASTPPGAGDSSSPAPASPFFLNGRPHPASPTFRSANEETRFTSAQKARVPPALFGTLGSSVGLKFIFQQGLQGPAAGVPLDCLLKPFRREEERQQTPRWAPGEATPQSGAAGPIVPPIQAASDGYLREASPFSREAGYVLDSCGAHFDWLRVYREGIEVFLCQLSAAYRLPGSRHVGTDSPSVILPHLTFSLVLPVSFLHCRTGLYPPVLSSGTSSSTGVPQSQGPASRTDLPSFVSTSCTAPPEERELSVQRLPLFQFDFPLSYRTLYKAAVFAGVAGFSQFASASFEACARVTVTTESCSWLRALGAALRAEAALSVRGSILAKSSFQCPSEAGSGHATAGPPVPAMAASERLGSRLAFHRDGRAKVETISDSLAEAVQRARLAMSGAEGFWRAALDQLEVFRRQQQRVLGAGQSSSGGKPQPLLEAFARGRLATMSALLSVIAFCSKCCHVPRLPGHRQKSSSTPKYPKEVRKVEQTQLLSSSPAVEPGRQSGLTVVFRHPPPEVISPSSAASPLPPPHVPVASSRCLCGSETCETCACGAKAPEVSLLGSSGRSRVFCLEDAIEVRHEGAVFEEILASLEQLRSQFRGLHVQFSHFATQPLPLCPTSRRLLGLQDCLCRTGVLLTSFLMTRLLRSHALILCFSRGFRYIRRQPLCKCISAARPNEKGEQLPQSQQSEKAPAYIERNTTSRSQYGRARGSNPPKVSTHAKKNATDSPEWHPANNTVVDTSENMEGISESSPSLPEPAQLGSGTDAKYLFSPVLGLVSLSSDGLFGLSGAVEQLNVALEALASARHTRSEFLPFSPSCCSFAHRPESLNLLPLWLEASASSPGHALCWRPANSEILDTTSTREMSPHVVWSRKASVCPEGCSSGPARCATSTQRDDEREGALQLPVSDGALLSVCAACDRVGQQKVCTQGCGGGVSPRLTSKLDIGRVSAPANNETRLVKTEENTESDAPREARTSDYCALPLLHAQKVRPFYFLENLIPRLVLVAPPLLVCKHSGSPAVCASRAGSHVSAAPRAETRSPAVVPQNRVPSPGLLEGTSSDSEGAGYAPPPPTHEGSRASTGAVTSVSAASDATSQENSGTERRDVVGDRGKGITGARNQTAAVVCNDPGVIDVDNEGQTVTVGQESSNKGSPAQFDCDALRGDTRRGTGENREDTQEGRSHSGDIKKDDATPRVSSKATFFETDQIDACSLWGNLEEEEDTTASSLLLRTAFPPVLLRQVVELVEHCMYTPFPLPPRIFNPRPLPWVAVRAVLSGEEEDSRGRCVLPTIFFTGELRDAGVQTVAAWDFVRLRLSVGSGQGSFQQATLHSSLQVRDKGQDVISVDDVPVTQPVPQTRSLPRSKDSFRRGGAVQKNASPLRHAGGLRTFAHTTVLNVSMAVLPCLLVEALPLDSRRRVIGERSSTFVAVRTAQKDLDL
ncbi:hypothetical protein CSUI_000219 [Cystoisospora suis]|uniref:Uncharacterized protein n=1 Tax=Cystoisospora suis TaxID=483139 RepID=A0A2C6LGH3_9APIC|nr:hypothetical protein CSUI_000219 [Cystoisospora suis]